MQDRGGTFAVGVNATYCRLRNLFLSVQSLRNSTIVSFWFLTQHMIRSTTNPQAVGSVSGSRSWERYCGGTSPVAASSSRRHETLFCGTKCFANTAVLSLRLRHSVHCSMNYYTALLRIFTNSPHSRRAVRGVQGTCCILVAGRGAAIWGTRLGSRLVGGVACECF